MKVHLHMYVAQPKKGHWEVSIPWVAALAEPLRGPSSAELKEEMMFRVLELVHGDLSPAELDRLIPPARPYLTSIYLDVQRQIDVDRPEVTMNATTHVVVGTWPNDELTRLWLPRVPGTCLPIGQVDDMYAMLNHWARDWARTNHVEDLDRLQCNYVAQIESVAIDLGWPSVFPDAAPPTRSGRLKRPTTLMEVATNLSHRVEDGLLGRAYGRDRLVEELVEAIMSPRPQSICLIGPPGVGKTALVHEASRRAVELANAYQERRDVWQTSGDRIIAGMSIIGQWEQRTEALCRELAERGDILFAEELLGLVRAGKTYHGQSNVARFMEPYLEQDRFAVITEATDETWTWARTEAPGFADKFRRIQVPELSYRETLGVIGDQIREIEGRHRMRFAADGVETLLHLARRFFKQEAFPGKAVRLVRQCHYDAARQLNDDPDLVELRIGPEEVSSVVQRQTGLPPTILRPGLGRTSDEVRGTFEARVFGQPRAVDVVTRLVLTIEQGLTDPKRPLAALLLVGPSGVGKTETAKALANDLFGSDERLVRFDMSEFSGPSAVSRLIGTASNPDGELTSKVRLQPFCVLLFDEVEKGHSMVLDLLLQLLGDGRLTDAAGRTVDFRNAIVVMTSNLGANAEDRWLGFSDQTSSDRALHYRRAAEEFFRPELFNRIDHVVPYAPLGPTALRRIARRTLQGLLERRGLRQAQVMVDVDEGLIDFLAGRSVDPRYGARTLANRIEQTLVAPLARELTSWENRGELTRVIMVPSGDGIEIRLQKIQQAPRAEGVVESAVGEDEPVLSQFAVIVRRFNDLRDDPRVIAVRGEYEETLEGINRVGSSSDDARHLADELRRRESFLNRYEVLERRMNGLQDPRGTGEFVFANVGDERERKGREHRWSSVARELRTELAWLSGQLDALTAEESRQGATLVVSGLSGPYRELLSQWQLWLSTLAEDFDFEAVWAFRGSDGGWQDEQPDDDYTALAVSTLTPGADRLFSAFEGYTWSPRLPSHGQHALVAARARNIGFPTADELVEKLRSTVADVGELMVEFVETDGTIEDLRTGRVMKIPDDRASNLRDFLVELAFGRQHALSGGADG